MYGVPAVPPSCKPSNGSRYRHYLKYHAVGLRGRYSPGLVCSLSPQMQDHLHVPTIFGRPVPAFRVGRWAGSDIPVQTEDTFHGCTRGNIDRAPSVLPSLLALPMRYDDATSAVPASCVPLRIFIDADEPNQKSLPFGLCPSIYLGTYLGNFTVETQQKAEA